MKVAKSIREPFGILNTAHVNFLREGGFVWLDSSLGFKFKVNSLCRFFENTKPLRDESSTVPNQECVSACPPIGEKIHRLWGVALEISAYRIQSI